MDFNAKGSMLRHKQTPDVLPASQYLQDRLTERRARNTRPKRARQSDFGPRMNAGHDDDLFFEEAEDSRHAFARSYDSSPLAPISRYTSDTASSNNGSGTLSAGGRKRRTPGARELDEQMDRLTKQNFDLKLELDHRRESQARMQAEIESMRATVERAEKLEEEHEELMRINSLLVEELEKRDRAIQEATEIICDLEEKVEDYEESRATETRPSTAHADSGYAGTDIQEHMSSPPRTRTNSLPSRQTPGAVTSASNKLSSAAHTHTPTRSRREPGFLTSQKPSTTALRSVYLDAGKDLHPVKSFNSILSRNTGTIDEMVLAEEVLNSPRLSALSESSFPSIYGKKNGTPEHYDWEELPESTLPHGSAHSRQDSITRVSQWIEDPDMMAETPSRSNHISSPLPISATMPTARVLRRSAENSIQSLSSAAASARSNTLEESAPMKAFPSLGKRAKHAPRTPTAASFPAFEDSLLPPTPESVSTQMLRPSRSSFAGERSLLDTTPAQVKSFAPLEPILSSGGHGFVHPAPATATMKDVDGDFEEEENETYSDALQDNDYDDYPDGNSITRGTPSRFMKHGKQLSIATNTQYDNSTWSPPTARLVTQRRNSSSEIASSPYSKPEFHRADSSPNAFGLVRRFISSSYGRPMTADSPMSPQSYDSNSSSTRTATQDLHYRSPSPEPAHRRQQTVNAGTSSPRFRTQQSPAPISATRSSFSQKTQSLFRRLSSTNTTTNQKVEEPRLTPRRERERSPLPTLTSTPSAAYQMPVYDRKEIRRPNTSASMRPAPTRTFSRDASSSRPNISPRTMTAPNVAAGESSGSSMDLSMPVPRKGLLRRGGSIKHADVSSVRSLR